MTVLVALLLPALLGCAVAGAVFYTHAQVWRERAERYQDEAAVLSGLLTESYADYAARIKSLQTDGWVRLSSDEELAKGRVR